MNGGSSNSPNGFRDRQQEQERSAELLAEEVRSLRKQLEEVPGGPQRKTQRKRILLQIDVRQWKMGLLNPKNYGKKCGKEERFDIGIGGLR
jgi:hypothetical protein